MARSGVFVASSIFLLIVFWVLYTILIQKDYQVYVAYQSEVTV